MGVIHTICSPAYSEQEEVHGDRKGEVFIPHQFVSVIK